MKNYYRMNIFVIIDPGYIRYHYVIELMNGWFKAILSGRLFNRSS